jgi:tetratricopeptide (TPR) repeat protein
MTYLQKSNRKSKKTLIVSVIVVVTVIVVGWLGLRYYVFHFLGAGKRATVTITASTSQNDNETPTQIPATVLLLTDYYVSQTFNNCASSALSMDFSFFGVSASQQQISDDVRPDNNLTGKGDDKSTFPDQLVQEAEKYGLIAYFRPNGNIDLLKQFIANGIPVITKTLLNTSENYAHYRVIKGYDDTTGIITDEDGFQGPNIQFSYNDFMTLWKAFGYEYVVVASPNQQSLIEKILGGNLDEKTAWTGAVQTAKAALAQNPNDNEAGLNLSVAEYYTGDYQGSIDEYQKIAPELSKYALWYQIEPIESYLALGDYSQVFSLTNNILNSGNQAFPELYVLQGDAYEKEGDISQAKQAFEQALIYNKNLQSAQNDLSTLSS